MNPTHRRLGAVALGFCVAWASLPSGLQGAQRQSASRAEKTFLVASVKRSAVQRLDTIAITRERLLLRGFTLRGLIRSAYERPLRHQIEGGPKWIDEELFDVEATMPAGTPFEDQAPMLRSLLRDRFKLVATVVTKQMAAQALVVRSLDGRLGSRISRSAVDCSTVDLATTMVTKPGEPRLCDMVSSSRRTDSNLRLITLHGRSVALAVLADLVSNARRVPVVDRTGLTGVFDFDIEFQSESAGHVNPSQADAPRIETALEEQLGLMLRPTRAPIDVLLIENAERPTPN